MRKLVLALLPAVLLVSSALPVVAQEAQPSQGDSSAGRNIQGTGFGPHCHVVVPVSGQGPFDFIAVMPSHEAHLATNAALGASAVFEADPNCDGDPGA
jgi:hypothetical protein